MPRDHHQVRIRVRVKVKVKVKDFNPNPNPNLIIARPTFFCDTRLGLCAWTVQQAARNPFTSNSLTLTGSVRVKCRVRDRVRDRGQCSRQLETPSLQIHSPSQVMNGNVCTNDQ
jgi:hypothetical protein